MSKKLVPDLEFLCNSFFKRYELVSYDESYEDYLKAMGLPFFVIPMILGNSETLTITVSNEGDWKIVTKNGKSQNIKLIKNIY